AKRVTNHDVCSSMPRGMKAARPGWLKAIAEPGGSRFANCRLPVGDYCAQLTTCPSSRSTKFLNVFRSRELVRNCTLPSANSTFAPPECADWIGVPQRSSPLWANTNVLEPMGATTVVVL